jgi:hypothetical protein
MRISPETGSEINLRSTPPIRSSPIDEWFDIDAYEAEVEPEVEPGVELGVEPGVESGVESGVELGIQPESEPTTVVVQFGDLP